MQPLSEDVPQLHYWSDALNKEYGELLGLGAGDENWIYLGGTSKYSGGKKEADADGNTAFKQRYRISSCGGEGYICDICMRWRACGCGAVEVLVICKRILCKIKKNAPLNYR